MNYTPLQDSVSVDSEVLQKITEAKTVQLSSCLLTLQELGAKCKG
jgi:hypothetical protein